MTACIGVGRWSASISSKKRVRKVSCRFVNLFTAFESLPKLRAPSIHIPIVTLDAVWSCTRFLTNQKRACPKDIGAVLIAVRSWALSSSVVSGRSSARIGTSSKKLVEGLLSPRGENGEGTVNGVSGTSLVCSSSELRSDDDEDLSVSSGLARSGSPKSPDT